MDLTYLKIALDNLKQKFVHTPSELERDGLIKRFNYSVELCWKTSKKILSENGIQVDVPKNVFRKLAILGWIDHPEKWFEFISKRNKISYIYNQTIAEEIFAIIPDFIIESDKLLTVLEKKSK
jgi:nucleotidyltransferase substrate binding protein (TIGR01987 family)